MLEMEVMDHYTFIILAHSYYHTLYVVYLMNIKLVNWNIMQIGRHLVRQTK